MPSKACPETCSAAAPQHCPTLVPSIGPASGRAALPASAAPTERPASPPRAPGPQVKAILVNIFGGIMRCDVIASGIVNAAKQASRRGGAARLRLSCLHAPHPAASAPAGNARRGRAPPRAAPCR